jgi:hypothetical protein
MEAAVAAVLAMMLRRNDHLLPSFSQASFSRHRVTNQTLCCFSFVCRAHASPGCPGTASTTASLNHSQIAQKKVSFLKAPSIKNEIFLPINYIIHI